MPGGLVGAMQAGSADLTGETFAGIPNEPMRTYCHALWKHGLRIA